MFRTVSIASGLYPIYIAFSRRSSRLKSSLPCRPLKSAVFAFPKTYEMKQIVEFLSDQITTLNQLHLPMNEFLWQSFRIVLYTNLNGRKSA